jgi:hypothetical protein
VAVEHDAYRAGLAEARKTGIVLAQKQVQELRATYGRLLRRLDIGATNPLTAAREAALRAEVRAVFVQLKEVGSSLVAAGASEAVNTVVGIHRDVLRDLSSSGRADAGLLTSRLGGTNQRALIATLQAPGAGTFKTLMSRHMVGVAPVLDDMLRVGVLRGMGAGEVTGDVLRLLTDNDPELQRQVLGVSSSTLHKGGFGAADLEKYGIDPANVGAARTVLYDARRIAVSTVNNALREGNRHSLIDGGVVTAAKWGLSGRHQIPDACDVLHEADVYGYGPGMYPPENWPHHPHPFCACPQIGPVKTLRPSEWAKPKPAPPPPSYSSLAYDPRTSAAREMAARSIKSGVAAPVRPKSTRPSVTRPPKPKAPPSNDPRVPPIRNLKDLEEHGAKLGASNTVEAVARVLERSAGTIARLEQQVMKIGDEYWAMTGREANYAAVERRRATVRNRWDRLKARETAAVQATLKARAPVQVHGAHWGKGLSSGATRKKVQEGLEAFAGMVPGKYTMVTEARLSVTKLGPKGRAYHQNGTIAISPNDRVATVVHEMGHYLEHTSPTIHNAAQNFLRERTQGEALERLRDVTGNKGYTLKEMTRKDQFFHPYVGKDYGTRASEVFSMGMEEMVKDPANFFRKDRGHFTLILRMIRGEL